MIQLVFNKKRLKNFFWAFKKHTVNESHIDAYMEERNLHTQKIRTLCFKIAAKKITNVENIQTERRTDIYFELKSSFATKI